MKKFDHKKYAEKADWEDLVSVIFILEQEKNANKQKLTKKQLEEYDLTISIYEEKKLEKLKKMCKPLNFKKNLKMNTMYDDEYEIDLGDI